MKKYICPVCGYQYLDESPYDKNENPSYEICNCCGFEFGFDDSKKKKKFDDYRKSWIDNGAKWFMPNEKPLKWNLQEQLKTIMDR